MTINYSCKTDKLSFVIQHFEKELAEVDTELVTLPAGNLIRRGSRYYHMVDGKEVGITKNIELIQSLYRKRFLLSLKKRLERNISIISRTVERLVSTMPNDIIESLPASYQERSLAYFHHPSMKKWEKKTHGENSYKGRKYETKNSVILRSKSEFMIASLLEEYNIPYFYESSITLKGQTKYPDFLIINPFSGKLIIWEHFGALHIQEYEESMTKKMQLYMSSGFIPFETLIYTFEFDMNTKRLRNLIENNILSA